MLTNDSWLDREQRELLLQEPDECIAVFGDFIRYVVICWTENRESCYFRSRTNVSLSLVTSSGMLLYVGPRTERVVAPGAGRMYRCLW